MIKFNTFITAMQRPFDCICASFCVYSLSTSLFMQYLPQWVCWIMDLFSILLFIYSYPKVPKSKLPLDINIVLILMIVWAVFLIICSFFDGQFNIGHVFTQPTYVLPLFLPILLNLKITNLDLKSLSKWCYFLSIIALMHLLIHIPDYILNPAETLNAFHAMGDESKKFDMYFYLSAVETPFYLVLSYSFFYIGKYQPFRRAQFHICFAIILSLITTMSFGRRSASVFCIIFLLSPFVVGKEFVNKKVIILVVLLLMMYSPVLNFVQEYFPILSERMLLDNRSEVDEAMLKQTNGLDFLFGKGLSGTYILNGEKRGIIETGFLYIILQKGVLYLGLYLYLLFRSIFIGIMSHNRLKLSMAIFLVIVFLLLKPGGNPSWSMLFFVVYICINVCTKKQIYLLKYDN